MVEIDKNRHLLMALIELDLIREDYLSRKNRQSADNLSRAIQIILNDNQDIKTKWIEEQTKWKM